jgi:hypothetical protein
MAPAIISQCGYSIDEKAFVIFASRSGQLDKRRHARARYHNPLSVRSFLAALANAFALSIAVSRSNVSGLSRRAGMSSQ